jgi:DNA-binding response OmpR family regulator
MRLLVADDDPDLRDFLAVHLESWGYELAVVPDGTRALEALRAPDGPSLAILDSDMPGLTGPEVCARAKAEVRGRPLHLILLTARAEEEDVEKGLDAGADDYVPKPFKPRELHARLRAGERAVRLQEELAARVRELEAALSKVRTLEGMLPICMYCKKVRDDKNYWQQVEGYVAKRTGATFSHGVCPDCIVKYIEPEIKRLEEGGAIGP